MYGGSSKLGRGGGPAGRGAGAKRLHSSFPLPPTHRPSGPASGGRLSLGGSGSAANPRSRGSVPAARAAAPAVEETFSLVSGNNPLAFSMIIRLAPDLVDEIKRVEAQGGTARIKFDSMANNPNGNVIDVGGKKFRFTWSQELGDLCDIYEERQSGEDGNGLLVESGSAWRKVNVQRILDESTKNHVKMRSEEAERKLGQRKAIVIDHENPSMKNQIKQLVAVETNPWRSFKKKDPPFKKRKVELPQVSVGGPPKSTYKSGISSTATGKGRHSSSPPEQSGPPLSPLKAMNISKSHTSSEDVIPTQLTTKDKATASTDKEIQTKTTSVRENLGRKGNVGAKSMDLQSMLITLLKENPKGMSFKALEKAIGDSIPNTERKIEPIIKKIATYQAPGRYFLKPGVDSESFKKPSSEGGSSPEEILRQTPVTEDNRDHTPAPEPHFKEKVPSHELEEQGQYSELGEESNALEKINIQKHSPDLFGEKKGSDNSEGQVGSSSDSGSDSDSESDSSDSGSDSGSPSRSRSRSRSPVGSKSGSDSDSDSDVSSNSKEGSDEDVDIMTSDDDKEPKHKLQSSEPGFPKSPIPYGIPDGRPTQGENCGKQDDHAFDAVEIEQDLPDAEQETEMAGVSFSVPNKENEKPVEETKTFSPHGDELQKRQNYIVSLFDEGAVKESSRHEQSDSTERTFKGKHKRGLEVKHIEEKTEYTKRSKTDKLSQPSDSGGRDVLSSDRLMEDPYRGPINQVIDGVDRDDNTDFSLQKGYNQAFGKSSSDSHQSGRRSFEKNAKVKAPYSSERPENYAENLGRDRNYSEKSSHVSEVVLSQNTKFHRDAQYEDGFANEKVMRKSKEGGARGKQSVPFESQHRKHGEVIGKSKEGMQVSSSLGVSLPKDNSQTGADKSPSVNGRGSKLQRELSDLELGELREPLPEEAPIKKQSERISFKQSENKSGASDNQISDFSKGKAAGKSTLDSGKPCSPDLNGRFSNNVEGSNKKRNHEDRVEDLMRSQQRAVQSQSQYLTRIDHVESGPQDSKLAEMSNRQGTSLEGYGESNKKAPVSASRQLDSRRGPASHSKKESKGHTCNSMTELLNGRKESLAEGNNSDRKRRDSSSDENSCSYSKYEKDEPDLKGPIKDFSQYKEYVQEYRDKYDSYCSLNKILESYRSEFNKLGKDLEYANGRDMERYYNILEQLKESYRQCGKRHKRLKKVFVVLHEELKVILANLPSILDYSHWEVVAGRVNSYF
ncbi:hypothetical protein FNV43_RR06719 [Rhamnella rubrinervis]|uniref:OCEL domain-containing protein n=1 Tax=Rhamnella rubrinervis TaxID=2594499 RepID=A0A8K0HF27_9ROSA|nr:hypothetical protein FNV43_RR06719 [Rhamnella rubrinervis]